MTDTNQIRKLYDDADTLHRMIINMGDAAYKNLPDNMWERVSLTFESLADDSTIFLRFMADAIQKLEIHPESNPPGGIYMDGVRQ